MADRNSTIQQGSQQDRGIESGRRRLRVDHRRLMELDKQWAIHYDQFQRFGGPDDIEKAVECITRALESTPEGDPFLFRREGNLGLSYSGRFKCLGKLNDLEKAIEHGSRAVALTPEGYPDVALWLGNLGNYYQNRFRQLGGMDDLERTIEHHSHALALTPGDHPDLSHRHASLGASYRDRFRQLGGMHDLEMAVEHQSRALALTPSGHPFLSDRHDSVGMAYIDRFERMGEMHDLEMAIEHQSRALALTPDDHPDLSRRHAGLGLSYTDRFERMGKMHDLERSFKHHFLALALTPDGHPSLSDRHASLGVSYSGRYQRMGDMLDLEKAIEYQSRALELTPDDHPDLSLRHTNLGGSYIDRFLQLGEMHDLEKSIEHHSRALALTPDGHPYLSNRYSNRAYTLFSQYQHTSDPAHLASSLHFYRKASQLLTGSPRDAFKNALKWAYRATLHSSLNCIEAYQTTIDLLPQFVSLGATTAQRYQDLSQTGNLAINAANAAILHSDPDLALEWLEHARCVVWNQSLALRTPLDQLRLSRPDLSSRLQLVSKQLHEAGTQPSIRQASNHDSEHFEEIGKNRRRLAQEYSDLLVEARTLPGFESFLQPMKTHQLVRAARYGPIVVINCHEGRCDALVILPGEGRVKHLHLPNFTAKEAQSARSDLEASLRKKGLRDRGAKVREPPIQADRMESVLLTLWTYICYPILRFLDFINDVPSSNLPHITWCPTGALSFLPFHAAGNYNQPRSRVFDYAVSSYTPTLTALLTSAATSTSLSPTPRLLAISQTNTPGCTPLPGTAKELAYMKARTQNNAHYSELVGSQATIAAVLDEMGNHDWVHLACHAHQNVRDPNQSGFFLHDGTLDLASINQKSFENKGLAFLSACQTATGDEQLPDEAVHLASGMLMAGYRSVIATMWSVGDADAPLVADMVYAQLMKDRKLGDGEAGRALHSAVAELRGKIGEKEFSRWVPYIHIGA